MVRSIPVRCHRDVLAFHEFHPSGSLQLCTEVILSRRVFGGLRSKRTDRSLTGLVASKRGFSAGQRQSPKMRMRPKHWSEPQTSNLSSDFTVRSDRASVASRLEAIATNGAPGPTRNGARARSKDATRGSWHRY